MNGDRISSRSNNFKSTVPIFSINLPSNIEKIRFKIKKLKLEEYRNNLKEYSELMFKQNCSFQICEEDKQLLVKHILLIKSNLESFQCEEPLIQLRQIIQSNYHVSFIKLITNSNLHLTLINLFLTLNSSNSILINNIIFIFAFLSFDEKFKIELINNTGLSIFVNMIYSSPICDLENLFKLIINISTKKYEKETLVELNVIEKIESRIDDICTSFNLLQYVLKLSTKLINISNILRFSELIIISIELILNNIYGNLLTTSLKLLSIASCNFSVIYYIEQLIGIHSIYKCLDSLSFQYSQDSIDPENSFGLNKKLVNNHKKNLYYCISILVNISSKVQIVNVDEILMKTRYFLENKNETLENNKLFNLLIILLNNLCDKSNYKSIISSGILEIIVGKVETFGNAELIQNIEDFVINLLNCSELPDLIYQIKKINIKSFCQKLGKDLFQKILDMLNFHQKPSEGNSNYEEIVNEIKVLQNLQ